MLMTEYAWLLLMGCHTNTKQDPCHRFLSVAYTACNTALIGSLSESQHLVFMMKIRSLRAVSGKDQGEDGRVCVDCTPEVLETDQARWLQTN